ncbi:MAG: alpha-amylase family glycosyl hydrolase [Myxococcota bacterium]|nr:alpha-amylase family glycosyl hydrolase [Myxococcota bacterium]
MRPLPASLCLLALLACPEDEPGPQRYDSKPFAADLSEEGIAALNHMGPLLKANGTNFTVYSEHAERIDLLLFDDPESAQPAKTFSMHRFGDVWSIFIEGVGLGQHYGFRAWGPNWPQHEDWFPGSIHGFAADVDNDGNRFNPNKLLIDPYAKALHREHDWGRASLASGPARTENTYGAATKGVIVRSDYAWSESETQWREARQSDNHNNHGAADLILYEVHAKGFTADPASGVTHPGTYQGIGEKAAYLADLGITAVELLPIHEKPLDGGYWGYWNTSFFAPELSYAADSRPHRLLDEFKQMVDALHAQGIEVILDVVYNHTGEGGLWRERLYLDDRSLSPGTSSASINFDPHETASIYSFRGLDNQAYYALNPDRRTYWNNTGVGNQTRPNHVPMRRLIMDSLRYYVEELHIDGFRFDLAGILGEKDGDYNNWDEPNNTVLQDIIDDPTLRRFNTRIIAEPWTAGGNYGPLIGAYPASSDGQTGWLEWNARFRDWWRAFVNYDDWNLNSQEGDADGGYVITAMQSTYDHNGRGPQTAVNFVTSHDGFTMYDLVTYETKRNGCTPLNPVCCDDPASSWCEQDSGDNHNRSREWGAEAEVFKRQLMRNFFTAMMISHGTPMLLGGDEWMRTQLGNNNAYSSGADNSYNWFSWGLWQADDYRHRMHDFVRKLTRWRRAMRHAVSPSAYGQGAPFAWKSPQNTDEVSWDGKAVMIHYYDASQGPEFAVLINMERQPTAFTLPAGRSWRRIIDTQSWFDDDEYLGEDNRDLRSSYNVDLSATQPLEATYEAAGSSLVIVQAVP